MSDRPYKARGYSYQLVQKIRAADPAHIGVKLGCLCIEKNIPVAQVAKDLGVSRLTVYTWFEGKFYPKPRTVEKMKELLVRYELQSV